MSKSDTNSSTQDSPSGLSPFAVFSIFLVIFVTMIIVMAAILYAWVQQGGPAIKIGPDGTMTVFEEDDGIWGVQIIKMNPQPSVNSVHWYLMDIQGLTKDEGVVTDNYGYKQGEGKSVIFVDSDYNAKVSPGDIFRFHAGEGDTLADMSSLDDFSFRLKFDPTGDTIGYDVDFSS